MVLQSGFTQNADLDRSNAPGIFSIFIEILTGSTDHFQVSVFPPGRKSYAEQDRGQIVQSLYLKEEAILLAGCQHIHPFCAPSQAYTCRMLVGAGLAGTLVNLISRIEDAEPNWHGQQKLLGLVKVLLVYIGRAYALRELPAESWEMGVFTRFNKMVAADQFNRRPVTDYASALSVGLATLNTALRKVSGMTARQIIQYHIIYEAKKAAITSDLPMKTVASDLQFGDVAHFSKFFRIGAGTTYSDYKRAFVI
ncbi:Helix-turn-helix domain-containing protein [Dyadobacter soli]|uniref:Helix-turn-helix domain-containing protein n=1 Tax=Dyadobacter soli TaxID=659014 RepID=A0A1G8CNP9_9BACT|nr:Helix-turn-helix domain-containing protein [Dyadobacter soli]